jgi:uncharacterized caspase-like protein
MVRSVVAILVGWLMLAAGALADTRVALVIGNSAYQSVTPLTNPENDATDLASALTRIGFDVTLANNLDGSGMRAALRAFRDKAEGADMALVYFAGHGIEIDKQNYLIPVDADLKTDSDVMFDTIPLDLLNEAVSGARTLRMVLIDACRNNPFLGQIRVADSGRSIGRGLSPFEPTGGTMVAFAAKGGTVALDGSGRNSPFMKGLLAHLEEPGLDITLLFRKVRDSVLAETNNRQEPFTYGSLPGREIYLVPPTDVAAITPVPVPEPEPVAPILGTAEEEFAWSLLGESANPDQVQKYIRTFPQGVHVDEAFARLAALREIIVTADPAPVPPVTDVASLPKPATIEVPPIAPVEAAPLPDTRVAAVAEPVVTPEPVPEPVVDLKPLIVSIQKELRRAGCNPGPADGLWGPRSERAVRSFARDGDITIASTDPSEGLLDKLKSLSGTVCVQAPPPQQTEAPKKRTTTATTAPATPKPAQPAPVAQPEPAPAPEPEPSSGEDCAMGLFLLGPLGMAGCE